MNYLDDTEISLRLSVEKAGVIFNGKIILKYHAEILI